MQLFCARNRLPTESYIQVKKNEESHGIWTQNGVNDSIEIFLSASLDEAALYSTHLISADFSPERPSSEYGGSIEDTHAWSSRTDENRFKK